VSAVEAIEARGLARTFLSRGRRVEALRDVDLRVGTGQVVALTGPNGSGKSTLLRILATVLEPSAGTALVFGRDVRREGRLVRAAIGVSFESDRSLLWRLSGRQNLSFFARLRGIGPRGLRRAIRDAASEAGVLDDLDARAGRLPAGLRARLRLARAFLGDPPVLLLDEPLARLDRGSQREVAGALAERAGRGGLVLAATHAPLLIEAAARRILLERGRVAHV